MTAIVPIVIVCGDGRVMAVSRDDFNGYIARRAIAKHSISGKRNEIHDECRYG